MPARLRPPLPTTLLTALLLVPVTMGPGCARDTTPAARRPASLATARPVLPLPDEPPRLLHLASLELVRAEFVALGAPVSPLEEGLVAVLTTWVHDEALARTIAGALDWQRPLTAVDVDAPTSQRLASVPVRSDDLDALRAALDALAAADDGADVRQLPPLPDDAAKDAETGPSMTRVALRGDRLLLATTSLGLDTAPSLHERYADAPLRLSLPGLPGVPGLQHLHAIGSTRRLEVSATVTDLDDALSRLDATTGAMTSLVSFGEFLAAGSFAWTGSETLIRQFVVQSGEMVSQQPFLIRGAVEEISRRANAFVRTFDGRLMAGIDESGAVAFAMGSRDPKTSGVALLRLVGGLADDLSLLGTFFDGLPTIALRKNVGDAAGEPIHRIRLGNLGGSVPAAARGLLDARGRLELHVAFSRRAGAGMFVVGNEGLQLMRDWLKHVGKAPDAAASAQDLLGLRLAVPALGLDLDEDRGATIKLDELPRLDAARAIEVRRTDAETVSLTYEWQASSVGVLAYDASENHSEDTRDRAPSDRLARDER